MASKSPKLLVLIILGLLVFPLSYCNQADNYDPSEVSILMNEMVAFSKQAKADLAAGKEVGPIPENIWTLTEAKATRDEHLEPEFTGMVGPYLEALKGIQRGDSQAYFYKASIQQCKNCHAVYCGGPMVVINQL